MNVPFKGFNNPLEEVSYHAYFKYKETEFEMLWNLVQITNQSAAELQFKFKFLHPYAGALNCDAIDFKKQEQENKICYDRILNKVQFLS